MPSGFGDSNPIGPFHDVFDNEDSNRLGDCDMDVQNRRYGEGRDATMACDSVDYIELESLMIKYPNFVPPNIPQDPEKRSRPVCLFVNFLGTRKHNQVTAGPSDQPTISPLVHPTFEGCHGSRKEDNGVIDPMRVTVSTEPTLVPSESRSSHVTPLQVSSF